MKKLILIIVNILLLAELTMGQPRLGQKLTTIYSEVKADKEYHDLKIGTNKHGIQYLKYSSETYNYLHFFDKDGYSECYMIISAYENLNSAIKYMDDNFVRQSSTLWINYGPRDLLYELIKDDDSFCIKVIIKD
jgi:hypothetical protein